MSTIQEIHKEDQSSLPSSHKGLFPSTRIPTSSFPPRVLAGITTLVPQTPILAANIYTSCGTLVLSLKRAKFFFKKWTTKTTKAIFHRIEGHDVKYPSGKHNLCENLNQRRGTKTEMWEY